MPPRQRRQKGDGSLYQRKDGLWIGVIQNGYDASGKPRRKQVSSKKYATAQKKLEKAKRDLAEFGSLPTAGVTVEKWLKQWLKNVRVRPKTWDSYESTCRLYLIPSLGRRRLDQLAPQNIRDMEDWIQKPKDKGGLALSSATVHKAHRVLRAALNDGVREGVVTKNVALHVKAPSLAGKEQDAFTLEQARHFLTTLTNEDPLSARWAFALLTGERQGEVLGMEWDRIDLAVGTVDLSWQLQRLIFAHGCSDEVDGMFACGRKIGGACPDRKIRGARPDFDYRQVEGGLYLTRPKSQAGYRVIPLPAFLLSMLKAHYETHGTNLDGFVFTRDDGRAIDPSDDNAAWHDALAERGLPQIKLHAARHTAASLLLEAGVDAKVIQAILGHSSVLMTRAYQHASIDMARAGMGALNDLILGPAPAPDGAARLAALRAEMAELESQLEGERA